MWQDRRTADWCKEQRERGLEDEVREKTGLLLDPYFCASKIAWLLEQSSELRQRCERGEVLFGTIDSYLVWRLTGGKVHATDATNASRTLLYNINTGEWDSELLRSFGIPSAILPKVLDSCADYGTTDADLFGAEIPICGVAGDQQAAVIGQACFAPGMIKATFGTGAFVLLNTGTERIASQNNLLTTVAYQFGGTTTYALEGSVFIAGAGVQWLRDGINIVDEAAQSGELAARAAPDHPTILVPAFTGLGAPWWQPEVRGAIFGITRDTGREEIAAATLEAVCFQTRDLLEAMQQDTGLDPSVLRVDGGLAASDWTMQRLSDTSAAP